MKQRFAALFAVLFITLATALAQVNVKGVVVTTDGEPLPGVKVAVTGTDVVRATDADGHFALTTPKGAVLRFTYIGMKALDLTARTQMRVVMEDEDAVMDEVMVVAFGTAKKSAFTGSASVVGSDEIARVQATNALDVLNGRAAGVQINQGSNQPGQGTPAITVRGITSLSAGTAPLIIVDGAPFGGDINTLSAQDIESVTVLKDAASAALYGARGANGVVIMTTRRGQRGQQGSLSVDAKWGATSRQLPRYNTIDSPAEHYELWAAGLNAYAQNALGMGAQQALAWTNANLTADNGYGLAYNVYSLPEGEGMIGADGRLNPHATLGRKVNVGGNEYLMQPDSWDDAIYRTGLRQEYTVRGSMSGDKSTLMGSVNYLSNKGITQCSDYERLTARLNADGQITDWFRLAGNASYAHYTGHYITGDGESGSSGNLFSYTQIAPIYPVYLRDAEGQLIWDDKAQVFRHDYGHGEYGVERPFMANSNPLCSNQLDTNRNEGNAFSGTVTGEVRFLNDFKFTSNNTVNLDECRFNSTVNPYYGQYAALNGMAGVSHVRTYDYNLQQLLSWAHDFGAHNVEVMLGHEYYRSSYYSVGGNKSNQFNPTNPELSGAVNTESASSFTTDYNIEGWFGRAQWNYAMRYFASASFRRDGSSRFHPDHRWGNFYSVGGAWLLSREKWLKDVKWIDELKLKASYGEQGNDNIGAYRYTHIYTVANSGGQTAILPTTTAGNENIKWEKNANLNVGVEFSLWKGRLSGGVEYFFRQSSDLLYALPRTPSWGYTHKWYNIGDMYNSGLEVELRGDIIRSKSVVWSARMNLSTYKNRIKTMPAELKRQQCDGYSGYSGNGYFYGEGLPMYTIYMPTYAGVDERTGKALYWRDVTGSDGSVVAQEKTDDYSLATYHLQGSALPDVSGGFGTTLSWKGLDVAVDFSYQLGGKLYDRTYAAQMGLQRGGIMHADMRDAWTPQHTSTSVPRLQFNDEYMASMSSRFLTSASYLNLQNINVGYTVPVNRWWKHIQSVRVYASADNVWLWSARRGMDPRQSIAGASSAEMYAPVRTISGGVTINL